MRPQLLRSVGVVDTARHERHIRRTAGSVVAGRTRTTHGRGRSGNDDVSQFEAEGTSPQIVCRGSSLLEQAGLGEVVGLTHDDLPRARTVGDRGALSLRRG